METTDSSDVQWAQSNFPQQVNPPAAEAVAVEEETATTPVPVPAEQQPSQPVFLSIEQFEQLTQRIVAEKVAAIEAQYRQQIAALEAQTQELRTRATQAPVVTQIAVPAAFVQQPAVVQSAAQPAVVGQPASLAQPALTPTPVSHQYMGGIPLPARPATVARNAAPPVRTADSTPKNKFFLQDRRKVTANFDATDHRGVTLGSLNAGTVTNIAVGLQTRELFLNPSLRTPGIGGLI